MKKVLLFVLIGCMGATVAAAPVSQDEALRKASAFVRARHPHNGKQLKAVRRQPGLTVASEDVDASYYIFNVGEAEGFVIVSGDDRTQPILGYTDRGHFDTQSIPESVKVWLDGYAHELRRLQAQDAVGTAAAAWHRPAIAPMLTTVWNQNEPYNNECPVLPNSVRGVTGCVPTAMSQLMYYHRWPAATIADIPSYTGRTDWGAGVLTFAGAAVGTAFDWDKMKDIYSAEDSDEEVLPVATLMRVCGAAVKVNYRDNANGGSGAESEDAMTAFRDYFDYSRIITMAYREDYAYADWLDLIYGELQAGRPVIYGGRSSGGGHFFIVDGCDGNLFHVNWGWGGFCDGYFALSLANPGSNEGTGASGTLDGYGMQQTALIGIKKNEGEAAPPAFLRTAIVGVGSAQISSSYFNYSGEERSFEFGIGYAKGDGSYELVGSARQTEGTLPRHYGYSSVTFTVSGLADGVYKLVPVSRVTGTQEWRSGSNAKRDYVTATVAGGQVTLSYHEPVVQLTTTSFDCPGRHKIGRRQKVNVTISNSGDEFYGPVFFFVGQGGSFKRIAYTGITVEAGASQTVPFSFDPSVVGENVLVVATDQSMSQIIGQTTLNINPQGETGEHLSVTAFAYDNDNATLRVIRDFAGKLTVKNAGSEDFDGEMFLRLLYNVEGLTGTYSYLKDVYFDAVVPAGASAEVTFSVEGLTPGTFYWPMVCVGDTVIRNEYDGADIRRYEPDLDGVAAVSGAKADGLWYNLAGQRVMHPRRGVYVHQGKRIVVQ